MTRPSTLAVASGRMLALSLLLAACGDKDDGAGETSMERDADGDGYPATAHGGSDCDDGDVTVHPGAEEVCNGVDDDCDGAIDEDALDADTWHVDLDGDGAGDPASTLLACDQPAGAVADGTDCDDGDPAVHPGAEEACDGVDTDCDGALDEDEADLDGDGFDVCADLDCDDGDPDAWPEAPEDCADGSDQDCDGLVDCEDGDCAGDAACQEDCADGVDNDDDGLVDCEDMDDCAGTTSCPVNTHVRLTGGRLFMYAYVNGGYGYQGLTVEDVAGTVSTFDSASSTWRSCLWQLDGANSFNRGASVTLSGSWTASVTRWGQFLSGSCDTTRAGAFLPEQLLIRGGTTPRVARLASATALGRSSLTWYHGSGTMVSVGSGWSRWIAYGSLSSRTFWSLR